MAVEGSDKAYDEWSQPSLGLGKILNHGVAVMTFSRSHLVVTTFRADGMCLRYLAYQELGVLRSTQDSLKQNMVSEESLKDALSFCFEGGCFQASPDSSQCSLQ